MLQARRIKSGALKRLVKSGDESKVKPEWRAKVRRILGQLHIAVAPEELDLPGYDFHLLGSDRKGTYSVSISGNWRITFKWDDEGPYDVDMEDYHHGRGRR
ncbi:MAG: type II toxin-antitoxin system RelE/ParE family toxin [Rhodomicrobium sp.]